VRRKGRGLGSVPGLGADAPPITPEQVAAEVAEAIRENRFWIRTHPEMEIGIQARCEAVIAGETPPAMFPTEIA